MYVFNTTTPIINLPEQITHTAEVIDTHTFELRINNQQTLNDIFSILTQHHIVIQSVQHKINRLEALYLDLIHHADH